MRNLTLGQLYDLARYSEHRYEALLELDRRIPRNELSKTL